MYIRDQTGLLRPFCVISSRSSNFFCKSILQGHCHFHPTNKLEILYPGKDKTGEDEDEAQSRLEIITVRRLLDFWVLAGFFGPGGTELHNHTDTPKESVTIWYSTFCCEYTVIFPRSSHFIYQGRNNNYYRLIGQLVDYPIGSKKYLKWVKSSNCFCFF